MHRIPIYTCGLFLCLSVCAQDTVDVSGKYRYSVSYFGEYITHAGLKAGVEFPLLTVYKERERRNSKTKTKYKELFVSAYAGGYFHRRNHIGSFLDLELGYRITGGMGFIYDLMLGAGYFHSFLQGDTYTVSDNVEVDRKRFAGQSGILFPFSVGLGWSFGATKQLPYTILLRPGFFLQYPHNMAWAIRPTLALGFNFRL